MESYKNIVDEIWEEEAEELITYDYIMNEKNYLFSLIISDKNVAIWLYNDDDFKPHYFLTDDNDESCCEVEIIATIAWDMDKVEPTDEQLIAMFPCDYSGEHFYVESEKIVSYSWFKLV